MKQTICLIGFMGSGKTTLGQRVADRLSLPWIDLDQYIEKKEGKRIAEIFETEGEAYFRQVESQCLAEILDGPAAVLSTGGGVIVTPQNVERLRKQNTFFLKYPFEILYNRIKGDSTRPLTKDTKALKERFKKRAPLYEAASKYTLLCGGKSAEDVLEEIMYVLK